MIFLYTLYGLIVKKIADMFPKISNFKSLNVYHKIIIVNSVWPNSDLYHAAKGQCDLKRLLFSGH